MGKNLNKGGKGGSTKKPPPLNLGLGEIIDGKRAVTTESQPELTIKHSVSPNKHSEISAGGKRSSLGLGDILDAGGNQLGSNPSTPPTAAAPMLAIEEKKEGARDGSVQAAPGISSYMLLAGEGKWKELGSLCETHLSNGKREDPEAKLWWVRAQLKLGAIPAAILAAPLDTISKDFLSRANGGFSPDGVSPSEYRILEVIVSALGEMNDALKAKNETDLALAFQERRLALAAVKPPAAQPRPKPDFQSFKDKAEIVREARLAAAPAKSERAASADKKYSAGWRAIGTLASVFGNHRKSTAGAAAALAALISFWLWPAYFAGSASIEHVAFVDSSAAGPALMVPVVERANGLSNLAALYYDIDTNSSKGESFAQPARKTVAEAEQVAPVAAEPKVEQRAPQRESDA